MKDTQDYLDEPVIDLWKTANAKQRFGGLPHELKRLQKELYRIQELADVAQNFTLYYRDHGVNLYTGLSPELRRRIQQEAACLVAEWDAKWAIQEDDDGPTT